MSGAYILSFTASLRAARATVVEFRMPDDDPEDPNRRGFCLLGTSLALESADASSVLPDEVTTVLGDIRRAALHDAGFGPDILIAKAERSNSVR